MTPYYPGQWLENRMNGFMVEVFDATPDGGVTVMAGGQKVNTTAHYLDGYYRELGGA